MDFAIINASTNTGLTPDVIAAIAASCQAQLFEDYAPFWQSYGASVFVAQDLSVLTPNICPAVLVDSYAAIGDALGFHSVQGSGRPNIVIDVGVIMSNGGTLFATSNSVSVCLSHEFLEAIEDEGCNQWVDMPDGVTEDARELCDSVEADSYAKNGICVSNFRGPRSFSLGPGPWDFMQLLTSPFEVRPSSYAVRRTGGPAGPTTAVWGASYPAWKAASKHKAGSRFANRVGLV